MWLGVDAYWLSVFLQKELDACRCTVRPHPHRGPGDTEVSRESHEEKQVQCSEVSADNDCE